MAIAEGSLLAGRFELLERAGVGGMAVVFRARDRFEDRDVALKILRPDVAGMDARFAREAALLAELDHPRIVGYVDHGQTPDGRSWIAMEWLEGETLSARLRRAPLTVAESITVVRGISEGLAVAHRAGAIHRDVKPSNVFLVGRAVKDVRLLDFGIARVADRHGDLTETGVRVGTYSYMSPEQAWGRREMTPATDVFSLGCVLFACLTGRKPFGAKHSTAVLAKILLEPAPRVSDLRPDIAPDLDELVERMLSKESDARPADAGAVLAQLDALDLGPADRVSLPMEEAPEALTGAERRVVTLVLAANLAPPEAATVRSGMTAETATTAEEEGSWPLFRHATEQHGGRLDALADGTLVATFASNAGPIEHALKAAAYAVRLSELADGPPLAIATGLASLAGALPVGELIDRGVAALRRTTPGEIRVDDVTGGLLSTRYDLAGDDRGLRLLDARGPADEARQLMGRQSPFVGRRRELKTLEALYEECVDDEVSRVALVTGAAGVGKSRLRDELLRRLATTADPPTVLVARADPVMSSPLGLLADLVRRAAEIREGEPTQVRHERLRGRLGRAIGRDVEALERCAAFLGELVGAPVPPTLKSVELEAARADARLMGDRIGEAFEEWLAAETRHAPVVVVIEDLHWGDAPSVRFLRAALTHLAEAPWMLLALARPEVGQRFPTLWEGRHALELRLPGLSRKASASLVKEVLGADDARAEALIEQAQGNAFYLEELIRAVAEGRGDELPPTVLAMVQARLERLPEEARRILRAASVFGKNFWPGGLAALLGDVAETVERERWIDELVRAELITPRAQSRFDGEPEYAFRHALLREGAYGTLTDSDRARGHRLAADWLARAGERDSALLAEHFARGGAPEAAAPHFVRAAQQALEANDLEAVIELAERGAAAADGELLGRARLAQAEAHRWRGESALAFKRGVEATTRLEEGTSAWYRAVTEALLGAANQQRDPDVLPIVRRAVAATPSPDAALSRAIFICRARPMGPMRGTGVFQLFEELRAQIPEAGPQLQAWFESTDASNAARSGRLGQSIRGWDVSLAAFEAIGDRRNACTNRMNAGYLLGMLGAYERAQEMLWGARRTAEQLGLAQTGTYALHNLGLVVAQLGHPEEGLALERRALREAKEQDSTLMQAICHLYVAMIGLDVDPASVMDDAREAVERLASLPKTQPLALAAQARLQLRLGDAESAAATAERALEAFETHGVDEMEPLLHLVTAECLDAVGRRTEADAIARRGAAKLREASKLVDDEVLREAYLERVPENAALLARDAEVTS